MVLVFARVATFSNMLVWVAGEWMLLRARHTCAQSQRKEGACFKRGLIGKSVKQAGRALGRINNYTATCAEYKPQVSSACSRAPVK